jgi:cell pole-organizing protein PopZ
MAINKVQLDTNGENVRLSVPFSKVDVERRIVSGFATLDNVDKQADIVTAEASLKAFSKFKGNIREMHQPVSVGKMVAFKEDKYFDPQSKKFYSGIYVSAYVSKGAQNTWEKVLDGTLSGFSIGGRMNKYDDAYNADIDKTVRIIKDYDLVELSLVDNPANQFANILSIEKVDGVDILKGENAETELENVFWDKESGLVVLSENESEVSPVNGNQMENIGFVEKNDSEKTEMIKFLVDSAKGINSEITKEVSPMTDTTENTVETEAEDAVVETAEVAPEADAEVEKSDDVTEESTESAEDVSKADEVEDVAVAEEETVEADATSESTEATSEDAASDDEVSKSDDVASAEMIADLKSNIATAFSDLSEVVKSLHGEITELKKSLNLANAKLSDAERDFEEFGKRMDAVEADTAFRKSGDLGEIVQETQIRKSEQSPWGGRFLKTTDLFR